MRKLTMYRRVLPGYCIGVIPMYDFNITTLELPLIIGDEWRGGKPNESCVPFGLYELEPHSSEKYKDVYALVNHDLGVYHWPGERLYDTDRYACLIHVANWVHQLQGCIAPGMGNGHDNNGNYMLKGSKAAMNKIRDFDPTHLEILEFPR